MLNKLHKLKNKHYNQHSSSSRSDMKKKVESRGCRGCRLNELFRYSFVIIRHLKTMKAIIRFNKTILSGPSVIILFIITIQ